MPFLSENRGKFHKSEDQNKYCIEIDISNDDVESRQKIPFIRSHAPDRMRHDDDQSSNTCPTFPASLPRLWEPNLLCTTALAS